MKRKLIAVLTSVVLVLSLTVGLWYPSYQVNAAEEDADSEEDADQEGTLPDDSEEKDDGSEVDVPLGELVAHWTFDDNYNESVSGLTTCLGGKKLTYTEGVYGKAGVFNGKDTCLYVKDAILNLGNNRVDDNDKFTISAWVNLGDSKTGYKYLLDKGKHIGWDYNDDCNWNNPYAILFDGSEPIVELSNEFADSDKYLTEGTGSTRGKYVDGNEWFLLTVTYDGQRVKIYHDNLLLTQSNYTDGITFNNDELYIGCDGRLENYFKGAIDDLRIYTKTLSYDEVSDLYDKGVTSNKALVDPTKGVVAYYPFDDNLKDASDFKNDAEKVSASGKISYVVGMNGKAITMSKGSYIRVPAKDQLNLEDEFTVSFWLKNSLEGEFPILYRQNPSYTDNNDNDWTYSIYLNSWSKGEMTTTNLSTRLYSPDEWDPEMSGLYTDYNYEDNKIKSTNWVHYTYTYKDGVTKCYLNGELQNKSEESELVNIANASGDLLIGYDGDKFFTGAIDELMISTSCASPDDVEKEADRIDKINLSKTDVSNLGSASKGKTVDLTSIILTDGDTGKTSELTTDNKDITYQTSKKSIFTVSKDGKITGVKAGKAKLTVSYGPHTVVYNVVVK